MSTFNGRRKMVTIFFWSWHFLKNKIHRNRTTSQWGEGKGFDKLWCINKQYISWFLRWFLCVVYSMRIQWIRRWCGLQQIFLRYQRDHYRKQDCKVINLRARRFHNILYRVYTHRTWCTQNNGPLCPCQITYYRPHKEKPANCKYHIFVKTDDLKDGASNNKASIK